MRALGANVPDLVIRATEHIEDMIEAIEALVQKGMAYEADGNVFYSVETFAEYGKLSGRTLDDMRAGERIEPHESKRNPLDFALWKSAKEGEPSWPSPWGPGRPGWHIECSVMSMKYLGPGFDIHGGGSDLIFPHHENEIAQAEGLLEGGRFVRYWLHAGMVQMDAEKMSKSLGNFVLARDVVQRYPGEIVRLWALSGSYRSQLSFSEGALVDAQKGYERWSIFLDSARRALGDAMPEAMTEPRRLDDGDGHVARFIAAMDDDLNSSAAIAVVHDLVSEGNRLLDASRSDDASRAGLAAFVEEFREITAVLGFTFPDRGAGSGLAPELIELLLQLREEARVERAFDRADSIRDRLVALGVSVEDTAEGPRWRLTAATPNAASGDDD